MLLAVHISDGVLTAPWWLAGYAIAGVMLLVSTWRVRDEEIPRIALLTATFFIVSLIHVRAGLVSIHLLMNGLIGIVLGPRAALAIFCGLFLQYWLIGHGGWQTMGVNACVLTAPALLIWGVFRASHRLPWVRHPWFRALLVAASVFGWLVSLTFCVCMFREHWRSDAELSAHLADWAGAILSGAWAATTQWWVLTGSLMAALAATWMEQRLENAPEFPLGLLLGEIAVLATAGLNVTVLIAGGEGFGPVPPLVILVAHLPIAVFEGIVLGFTLGFLAKVKPELLGMQHCKLTDAR